MCRDLGYPECSFLQLRCLPGYAAVGAPICWSGIPAGARSRAGLSGIFRLGRSLRRTARAGRRSLYEAAKRQSRQNRTGKKRSGILAAKGLDVFENLPERLLLQRGGQPFQPARGILHEFRGRALVAVGQVIARGAQGAAEGGQARSDIALRLLGPFGDGLPSLGGIGPCPAGDVIAGIVERFAGAFRFLLDTIGNFVLRLGEVGGLAAPIILALHSAS
ncbi:hypothetical protein MPL3365_190013 [Mesorhizobium plurifarium]|uniref:Uncharacterized protein n=1 Tax=Mesorhizobium plurifarium TaxID=69974 RepID=A0A090G7N3_MESPL|nr:hypothetical protein MPL3365_190013 [Mesorhizobium plurifarium]